MENKEIKNAKASQQVITDPEKKIFIGTDVIVNPLSDMGSDHWRRGVVTYINKANKWFLVEFRSKEGDHKMRKCYAFHDIGRGYFLKDSDRTGLSENN